MQRPLRIPGLIAATHTPFDGAGTLNLAAVEKQAAHLLANRVQTVFIGGTTGESHSLALEERLQLAQRWMEVTQGSPMQVVVHVGSNSLEDAKTLGRQAARLGALAVAAMTPSYFKPANVDVLVECCAEIAGAAPDVPFYYYDIPALTLAPHPMPEFLTEARQRIPNFNGLKFSNWDLASFQRCLAVDGGGCDVLWGFDEALLAALALGGHGAVGSTYNFAAPIYLRLIAAMRRGDLAAARTEQLRSVQLIKTLNRFGFMGASKAVMAMLGVNVGPARLPNTNPAPENVAELRSELEALGFFDWLGPTD